MDGAVRIAFYDEIGGYVRGAEGMLKEADPTNQNTVWLWALMNTMLLRSSAGAYQDAHHQPSIRNLQISGLPSLQQPAEGL